MKLSKQIAVRKSLDDETQSHTLVAGNVVTTTDLVGHWMVMCIIDFEDGESSGIWLFGLDEENRAKVDWVYPQTITASTRSLESF